MPTTFRVPYITAWSGEFMEHPLGFAWADEAAGLRLAYSDPQPQDWMFGVLWARQGLAACGRPEWKLVNTFRQRRCMLHRLCQVCGASAVDQLTGRTWWVLADEPHESSETAGYTNAPPTCLPCIPGALTACPRLRRGAAVYTVGDIEPYGVVADLFTPTRAGEAIHVQRSVTVTFEEFRRLEKALAKQLLVVLDDVVPFPGVPTVPGRGLSSPNADPSEGRGAERASLLSLNT